MKQNLLSTAFLLSLTLSQYSHAQDILKLKNGDDLKVKVQEITPQEIKYKRFDNLNGPIITILKNTAISIQYENGTTEKLSEDPLSPPLTSYVEPNQTNASTQPNSFEVGDTVRMDYYGTSYQGKVIEVNGNKNKSVAIVEFERNDGRSIKVKRQFYELTHIEKANSVAIATPGQPIGQNYADLFMQGQTDAMRYYQGYHGAGTGTFLTTFLVGPILGLIPAIACSSTAPSQDRLGFPNAQLAQNNNYYTGYTQQARRIKSRKVWGNFGIATGILVGFVVVAAATAH